MDAVGRAMPEGAESILSTERSCLPANAIFVPGTTARGFMMYLAKSSSIQIIPEFLFASEWEYPGTEPEYRPMRPLSSGPTLLLGPFE
jgi:hypothetical protein